MAGLACGPGSPVLDLTGTLPPEVAGKRLPVRVTKAGGVTWLLPVYVVKDVQLRASAAGGKGGAVKVTLYDALYHPDLEAAIVNAMDHKYGQDQWDKATPVGNRVVVLPGGKPATAAATSGGAVR